MVASLWRFFWTHPTGRRPQGKPRIRWRDYIFHLPWLSLRIPQEELESVAEERDVWVSLLDLLSP